jgi:hypothetical protein
MKPTSGTPLGLVMKQNRTAPYCLLVRIEIAGGRNLTKDEFDSWAVRSRNPSQTREFPENSTDASFDHSDFDATQTSLIDSLVLKQQSERMRMASTDSNQMIFPELHDH